ncbi:hypothetical protein D3C80_2149540 [compost metagenome]
MGDSEFQRGELVGPVIVEARRHLHPLKRGVQGLQLLRRLLHLAQELVHDLCASLGVEVAEEEQA